MHLIGIPLSVFGRCTLIFSLIWWKNCTMAQHFHVFLFFFVQQSTPCKHPVIVLQDVAWTDLHALVEFIYHGEVNVHQRSLSSFLKTAEVLRVSGLTQQHGDDREQVSKKMKERRHRKREPTGKLQTFAELDRRRELSRK
jgi:hypothetical protein